MLRYENAAHGGGTEDLTVLSISPVEEDGLCLERLLNDSDSTTHSYSKWSVVRHARPEPALTELKENRIPIVLCENDVLRDSWRGLLVELAKFPDPPLLIVTSRLADERLWAEALNLGAWDVLATPLDGEEVHRTLNSAWLHWANRHQPAAKAAREGRRGHTSCARPPRRSALCMRPFDSWNLEAMPPLERAGRMETDVQIALRNRPTGGHQR